MDQLNGDDRMFWRKRGGGEGRGGKGREGEGRGGKGREGEGRGGKGREGEGRDIHAGTDTHMQTQTLTAEQSSHSLSGMPPFLQLSNGQELQSAWSKH